ncbi:DNA repair protein RecO [Candidatus Peregrinibacteria bacterium]|nr:DNA repair protein RecO [Candidatus Peregrinibacteria bacterium]
MREISHRGIVWSLKPYKEKDALITILTEEEGKIRLIAKGLRGAKSTRKGAIQLFSCIRFTRTTPKGHQGISTLLRSELEFSLKNSDPVVLTELVLLGEICGRFLVDGLVIPGVFSLWRDLLEIQFQKPREEICGFLVQFFTKLGFFPEFQKCSRCSQKFSEEKQIVWVNKEGIFCCPHDPHEMHNSLQKKMTFAQLKSLYFFQNTIPRNFSLLHPSLTESKALLRLIFSEISAFSDKPFASKKVLEEVID